MTISKKETELIIDMKFVEAGWHRLQTCGIYGTASTHGARMAFFAGAIYLFEILKRGLDNNTEVEMAVEEEIEEFIVNLRKKQ